eukprot:6214157-Pleurochrysis_carterae.AAC.1
MDKVKLLKETRTLRAEQELRQRAAKRRDRDLGANCLERRSGNKQRGGEHGDRKKGRAAAELRRLSMLSSDADVSRSLPARRAFTVATGPLTNTPPAPSSSSVLACVTAFPWEPNSAFCGIEPPDSFDSGPPTPLCRSISSSSPILFRNLTVLFHTSEDLFWDIHCKGTVEGGPAFPGGFAGRG